MPGEPWACGNYVCPLRKAPPPPGIVLGNGMKLRQIEGQEPGARLDSRRLHCQRIHTRHARAQPGLIRITGVGRVGPGLWTGYVACPEPLHDARVQRSRGSALEPHEEITHQAVGVRLEQEQCLERSEE